MLSVRRSYSVTVVSVPFVSVTKKVKGLIAAFHFIRVIRPSAQCTTIMVSVKTRLHQASMSRLRQLCDDARNIVLIENTGLRSAFPP